MTRKMGRGRIGIEVVRLLLKESGKQVGLGTVCVALRQLVMQVAGEEL